MANADNKNEFSERLIDAVERERCLWDLQQKDYKCRGVCEAAWRRVAAELGATVSDVKARWKNLRDTFRRVLKGRNEVKSGAAADDSLDEDKQWMFFVRLLFLKDGMIGRPTSGNLTAPPADKWQSASANGHVESAQEIFTAMYQDEGNDEASACDRTEASSLVDVCVEVPEPQPPKKKRKKDKYDEQIENITKILEKEYDEIDHFAGFLGAKMKCVPLRLRDDMQMEMLRDVNKYINST
nr:transcription factor Adf-1-like [Dermacentor andersoni]